MKIKTLRSIFSLLIVIPFVSIYGVKINFVADATTGAYHTEVNESGDATFRISVTEYTDTGNQVNTSFFMFVDDNDNDGNGRLSTANRRNGSAYGQGWKTDYSINQNLEDNATLVSGGIKVDHYLFMMLAANGTSVGSAYWDCRVVYDDNGVFEVTLPIVSDSYFEGGTGTHESIYLYFDTSQISSDQPQFEIRIKDDDALPYYQFVHTTSPDAHVEGNWVYNLNNRFKLEATTNAAGTVTYAGHNAFTIRFTITHTGGDYPTTDADHHHTVWDYSITENSNHGDIRAVNKGTADGIDEPDETYTITMTTSDSEHGDIGPQNQLVSMFTDIDTDTPPYAIFNTNQQTVSEGANSSAPVLVEVILKNPSGWPNPKVAYELVLGTSADADGAYADHDLQSGILTFDGPIGDQTQNIPFNILHDLYDEGIDNSIFEEVKIKLVSANAENVLVDENGNQGDVEHIVYIQDNDATPTLAFVASSSNDSETEQSPVIKVIVSDGNGNQTPSGQDITFNVKKNDTSPGNATIFDGSNENRPWDYKINGITGSVTNEKIDKYTSEYIIPLEINDDAFYEGSETVKFDVETLTNAIGGTFTHTYTINDDESKPQLFFNHTAVLTSTESGAEEYITGTAEVKLTGPTTLTTDFSFSITGVNAGETGTDDDYLNNNKDDNGDGQIDEANEGAANVLDTDFLLPATTGIIDPVSSTTDSESKATISFRHMVDKTDEPNKYIELTVAAGTGENDATAATDGSQKMVIKLVDDDPPIELSFASATDPDNVEGSSATISLKKLTENTTPATSVGTNKTEFTITPDISVGDSDNPATDGNSDDDFDLATSDGTGIASGAVHTLTLSPSADSASIAITTHDDALFEGGSSGNDEEVKFIVDANSLKLANEAETVIATMPDVTSSLSYFIQDNDNKPVITFDTDNSASNGLENGTGNPVIQIKQDRRSKFDSRINYTVTPENDLVVPGVNNDFILDPGTVDILAGNTTAQINLNILPDEKYENNETVTIALTTVPAAFDDKSSAGNANMSHDYVITNDDDLPKINFEGDSTSVFEDDASIRLKVSLTAISGVASTVQYAISGTADKDGSNKDFTDNTDPAIPNTLAWDADTEQDQYIDISFTDDNIDEDTETIIITLSNHSGGATTNGSDKLVYKIKLKDSDSPPPIGFALAEDTQSNTTTHTESNTAVTPSIEIKNGYSTEFDISVVWNIDTDNTTAIIDGQTNEDFEVRDATTGAPLANLNEASRTVVLAAGQTSVNLPSFYIPPDDLWEDQEKLVLTLSTPTSISDLDSDGTSLISADGSFITSDGGNLQNTKTYTIDNSAADAKPQVSIAMVSSSGDEGSGGNVTFTATLASKDGGAPKAGLDLYVNYDLDVDKTTAEETDDFILPQVSGQRQITIPAYESSASKIFEWKDDLIYEENEDIVLVISSSTDQPAVNQAIIADAPGNTSTYTINEDDNVPQIGFATFNNPVEENSTQAQSIVLEFKSPGSTSAEMDVHAYVSVDTDNSGALNGADFGSDDSFTSFVNNMKITISATESSKNFPFYVKADDRYEDLETAIFTINTYDENNLNPGAGITDRSVAITSNANSSLTVNIQASGDSEKPMAQWVNTGNDIAADERYSPTTSDGRNFNEGSGPAYFALQLSKYSEKEITVNYTLIEDENKQIIPPVIVATLGTDYSSWSEGVSAIGSSSALGANKKGTITFNALDDISTTNQYVSIAVVLESDLIDEWSETITLQIDDNANNSDVTGRGVTDKVFIVDDDPVPRISFTSSLSGGDADDDKEEALSNSAPTFTIELTDANGASIVSEKDLYFNIATNLENSNDITVATPTSDFGLISFNNQVGVQPFILASSGTSTATFSLQIEDDNIDEEDQNVTLTLSALGADFNGLKNFSSTTAGFEETPANAATVSTGTHIFTIQDDDPEPTAYFYAAEDSTNERYDEEGELGVKTVRVKTLGASEKNITLGYSVLTTGCSSSGGCATPDKDYTKIADGAELTILPSDNNEKSFTISTLDDNRDEHEQDIVLQLTSNSESNATIVNSSEYPGQYRLTIKDKDAVPTVDFEELTRNQLESNISGKSVLVLTGYTEKDVTIGYVVSSNPDEFDFVVNELSDDDGNVTWPEDIDMSYGAYTANISGLAGDADNVTMKAEIPTATGSDDKDEWDEKLKIVINQESSLNVTRGSDKPETVITIQDDDAPQTVEFTLSESGDIIEANGTHNIELSILDFSGKDIAIKYTIDTENDNPNDKDHATKGIDYNFGSSPIIINGDSIVTIRSLSKTVNIPLTIFDDTIYEEDQVVKIRISLANQYEDNVADPYYNSKDGVPGVDAILGSNQLYTHTIKDNEADPIVHFSSDVSAVEGSATPLGIETISVPIYLKDAIGDLVESEKPVVVPYVLDTDNSTASKDIAPVDKNKYEDDFDFTDASLAFTPITYTYNSVSDSYSKNQGENPKNISFDIYNDDLYELDETIIINLTEGGFENAATDGGDHSFTYTLQNDDTRPIPNWVDNYSIDEASGNADSYTNSDVKISLDRESGTDIFIQYSQKDLDEDDVYVAATITDDFNLDEDDADINTVGKKSVTIPAATSATSDLFKAIAIEILNDNTVEEDEKFIIQIDNYRDKNADGSLVANATASGITKQEATILLKDNDMAPDTTFIESILTLASDSDKENAAAGHWNPVTAGYWNSYNTGLSIIVPIVDWHNSLENGKVVLQALVPADGGGFSPYDFGGVEKIITSADITAGSITFEITAAQFEGGDWFVEGNRVYFRANIFDKYTPANMTVGALAATSIIIDETLPTQNNYTIESVLSKSGNEIADKWNGTNEILEAAVKFQNVKDLSVDNGSLMLFCGIGDNAATAVYDTLGSTISISSSDNEIGKSITFAIPKNDIELQTDFDQNRIMNFKVEVVDVAGNKLTLPAANNKIFIDTAKPTILSVESVLKEDYNVIKNGLFGIDDSVYIKVKFSETISITEGDASLVLGVASQPSILNTNLINVDSVVAIYTVVEGESSDSLSFSGISIINNGAALRDLAGNDMATDFIVPDGSSLKQTSAVQIDGIYPEDFTISEIWTDGSNIVNGYWNSTSTSLIVRVREYNSTEDTTLIDGTVQLKMRVYTNDNTTPGAVWLNLGEVTTLNDQNLEPDGIWIGGGTPLDYSQISNKALHFKIEAAVLEAIAGFPNLNANPQPEQNILIDFNAVITDKAGNQKLGTSAAQLTVDQVEPLDPKDGLPSDTYSYQFPGGITFDNYLDVTSEYDQSSGTGYSRSGYYNSTNNGITFKSWIGFDDLVNSNVTIDRDVSLVDGYVQVLMSSVADLAINNWKAVGDSVVITANDINSNDTAFVNVFVHDTSLVAYNADIFKENTTVYFRNKVTDAAGNSIYQDAISAHTILVDETAHSAADLLYSRKYINTDSVATVELTFPSDDPPFGLPKLSATFKATPAEPVVDKLMSDTLANNYTFYYNLDIPGSFNDPAYDDTVAISIDATDLAGNPLPAASLNNSKYLIVDNSPPRVWFEYANTDNLTVLAVADRDSAKGGDIVQIIAHLTEQMWKTDDVIATNEVVKPSLSIRTSSGILLSNDYEFIDGTYNELDSTITFNVEMPSTVEGNNNSYSGRLMMTINGVDLAVNTIQSIDGNIDGEQDAYFEDASTPSVKWSSFVLDNYAPDFRFNFPFQSGVVTADSFFNELKFGWSIDENLTSGSIKFIPISDPNSIESISLQGIELNGELVPSTLINQDNLLTQLTAAFGDSNTYNIVHEGMDYVGNIGQDTIKNVTFDKKAPTAQIFYETEYITSLSPKVGTVIRATFNEVQSSAPTLKLYYAVSSTVAQNATEDVSGTVQGVTWKTNTIDTLDADLIEEIIMDSTSETLSNRVWFYEIDTSEVKVNTAGIQWDGYVWAHLTSTDRAGNLIDSLQYTHFDNFLYLDNTEPTATITYKNLRDSTLTITEVVNEDELTNCCFAIYEDTVLVKVEMNELIKNDPANPPTISGIYNKDNVGIGSVFSNVQPIVHPDNIDSTDQTSLVLHYKVVIADSVKNNGPIDISFNGVDKAGTPVSNYGLSSQKSGIISNFALEVDNIHPWGFSENPIFTEETVLADVTFPTDSSWTSVKSTFAKVVDGWINAETDSIYLRIPHQQKLSDSSLYAPYQSSEPGWGPQGILDMQVQNLDIGLQWITVGRPDTITTTVAGGGIEAFNDYTYSRIISRPVDSLIFGVHLNQGATALNRLRVRARITDRNGNITNGQPSDMYNSSSGSLYAPDLASTDTIRYDVAIPNPPTPSEFRAVAGTFYPNDQDTSIISSDKVSIVWNPFVDPGEGAGSGIDQYEFQVYVYDSTWTPTTELDHVNVIDSLITVDINQDGFVDEGYWYPLDASSIPDIDNPFEMNLADTIVNNVEYDINDTLKHKYYYRVNVRSIDVAGNPSGAIFSNWMRRLNSSPIFNELSITTQDLFEDIAWDYDTLKVSDLDLSTNQGDSFTYFITTWLGSDTTGKKLTINPPVVDQSSGLISWKPIQEIRVNENGLDTLVDQQGEHTFMFIVRDDYYEPGFHLSDTLILSLIVTEVNDTPVVAITGEDLLLEWEEDSGEEKEINLTSYVTDIDHASSSMYWTYEIMDTSQLDEDFPTVMILPSDNKKGNEKSSLNNGLPFSTPDYKSFSSDMLASRSTSGSFFAETAADTLIIVTIDSTSTENTTIAKIRSTEDYHGQNHRILFFAKDPAGAIDVDTIIVNITPKNDVPIIAAELDTFVINENDSIWIDFADYTSDVDDSSLTFTIQGVSNTDSINYVSEPYISNDPGDSVLFRPFDLFSGEAVFNLTVEDGDESVQKDFLLDVRRVPRPYLDVSLVQNNAFSSYLNIIIIDTAQKTINLQLEVQNQRINVDTVAAYTYTGDFSFGIQGGYSFDIIAVAKVGKTVYTNTFNLAPARVAERWIASSPDGRLNIIGDPGSVNSDQNFLIVDSSLFVKSFTDQASYVLGDELFLFNNPIEVQFGSNRDDLAIYQRQNGVVWKELPSIKRDNQIFTFTKNTGYFRLGPKTMIVPEKTDLHQNYPNPFNPITTIKYDIGLLDGIEQKISVNVYNIMGQHVTTLINNISQAGQFSVKWQGDDKLGKMVPSGIYFLQLKTSSGIIRNKKMMLLK